jgi:DNA-binding response OmpR family regulator
MKKKVLIIDDIVENITIIKDCLETEDFEFYHSTDALEGLEIAKEKNPDLIILDLMMPKYDGYEICTMLSANKSTSEIPIVILSALNNSESIKKALESGATDFISKPFDCIELQARIKSALRIAENKKLSIEIEKNNFAVQAYRLANHKIKQPLTILKLANTSIKKELSKNPIEIEVINNKIQYIDKAITEISEILNDLERIFKEESLRNFD